MFYKRERFFSFLNLIVLKNGEIIEKGLTQKVLTRPENIYTKSLIESAYSKLNTN